MVPVTLTCIKIKIMALYHQPRHHWPPPPLSSDLDPCHPSLFLSFSPPLSLSLFPLLSFVLSLIVHNFHLLISTRGPQPTPFWALGVKKMPSSGSFLRQLSGKEAWKSSSKRWGGNNSRHGDGGCERSLKQMEGLNMYGGENGGLVMRKRVMVVVDHTSNSKHAMMWALTHVTNKGDILTLLHIIPPSHKGSERPTESSSSPYLANSLGSLCKACKPEVCDVEEFYWDRINDQPKWVFCSFLHLYFCGSVFKIHLVV